MRQQAAEGCLTDCSCRRCAGNAPPKMSPAEAGLKNEGKTQQTLAQEGAGTYNFIALAAA